MKPINNGFWYNHNMKRLTIQQRLQRLEDKINLLMNNHLEHLDGRIRRNEWLLYTIIFFLLGISWKMMT